MGKNKARKPKDWRAKKRQNPAWEDIKKENPLFVNYYKTQHILPDDEWETFMNFCRKDLPSTFRITKIRGHASDLLRSLRDGYISKISSEDIKLGKDSNDANPDEEEKVEDLLLEPIKWYPEELAWNSNLSRRFLRRSEILQKLHRFLVEDSECGAISRQEAVSMIPPMLLDVKSHHNVLDMCAAPGSKTSQLIEMMHDVETVGELPTGVVVANDADHKRCYLLTHQAKRLKSHCVMVTNHDASIFPKLYSKQRDEEEGQEGELMEFDRVLCDVPCSGDGTIRKNPLLWVKWTPHLGVSLHGLQIRILIRGLELLKVGGRLVYSTCSFNPIENEAVIATVLSKSEGAVALVDCKDELPGLKRRPGMKKWSVFAKDGKEYKCIDDVDAKPSFGYKDTMFPPTPEDADKLNLDYCMRIFPQDQNTGGFFIATFEKKSELPWQKAKKFRYQKKMPWDGTGEKPKGPDPAVEAEASEKMETDGVKPSTDAAIKGAATDPAVKEVVDENGTATGYTISETATKEHEEVSSSPPRKKFRRGMIKEAPYFFLDDNDKELTDIRKFYGLSSELPSSQFMIRDNEGKKRHIYLVSTAIQKIVSLNPNLKIINTGLKVMSRSAFDAGSNDNEGMSYRLVQDGAHLMSRYIKERIVTIKHADLVALLTYGDYNTENLDAATKERLTSITMGCVLWHYTPSKESESESELTAEIWLCGHYGHKVVQCMVTKEEKKHFLRLLGVAIPKEMEEKVKGPSWGDSEPPKVEESPPAEGETKVEAECVN